MWGGTFYFPGENIYSFTAHINHNDVRNSSNIFSLWVNRPLSKCSPYHYVVWDCHQSRTFLAKPSIVNPWASDLDCRDPISWIGMVVFLSQILGAPAPADWLPSGPRCGGSSGWALVEGVAGTRAGAGAPHGGRARRRVLYKIFRISKIKRKSIIMLGKTLNRLIFFVSFQKHFQLELLNLKNKHSEASVRMTEQWRENEGNTQIRYISLTPWIKLQRIFRVFMLHIIFSIVFITKLLILCNGIIGVCVCVSF